MTTPSNGHMAAEGIEAEIEYLDMITRQIEEVSDTPSTPSERFDEVYEELKPAYWTPGEGDLAGDATEDHRGMMGAITGSSVGAIGATAAVPEALPASTFLGIVIGGAMGGAAGAASYHAQKAGAGAAAYQAARNQFKDEDHVEATEELDFEVSRIYQVPTEDLDGLLQNAEDLTIHTQGTEIRATDEAVQEIDAWLDLEEPADTAPRTYATVETEGDRYGSRFRATIEDTDDQTYHIDGTYDEVKQTMDSFDRWNGALYEPTIGGRSARPDTA